MNSNIKLLGKIFFKEVDLATSLTTIFFIDSDVTLSPPRQKNVRFEDTISTATAKKLEDFKQILKKEKDLQNMKNKVGYWVIVVKTFFNAW